MGTIRHIQTQFNWRRGNRYNPINIIAGSETDDISFLENLHYTDLGITGLFNCRVGGDGYGAVPIEPTSSPSGLVLVSSGFTAAEVNRPSDNQKCIAIPSDTNTTVRLSPAVPNLTSIAEDETGYYCSESGYSGFRFIDKNGSMTSRAFDISLSASVLCVFSGRLLFSVSGGVVFSKSGEYNKVDYNATPVVDNNAIYLQLPYSVIGAIVIENRLYLITTQGIYNVTSNYGYFTPKGGISIVPVLVKAMENIVISSEHIIEVYQAYCIVTEIVSGQSLKLPAPWQGRSTGALRSWENGCIVLSTRNYGDPLFNEHKKAAYILDCKSMRWVSYSTETFNGTHTTNMRNLIILKNRPCMIGSVESGTVAFEDRTLSYEKTIPYDGKICLGEFVSPNRKKLRPVRIEVSYDTVQNTPEATPIIPNTYVRVTPDKALSKSVTAQLVQEWQSMIGVINLDTELAYRQKVEIGIASVFSRINHIAIDFDVED